VPKWISSDEKAVYVNLKDLPSDQNVVERVKITFFVDSQDDSPTTTS